MHEQQRLASQDLSHKIKSLLSYTDRVPATFLFLGKGLYLLICLHVIFVYIRLITFMHEKYFVPNLSC
jgi:uncharacterized membrane protein